MKSRKTISTRNKKKRSPLEIFVSVISVIMILLSLVLIFFFFDTMNDYYDHSVSLPKDSEYIWSVERGDYYRTVELTARSRAAGLEDGMAGITGKREDVKYDEEVAECQAVADYYKAAVLHHAAQAAGKADLTAAQQKAMDEAYTRMGSHEKHAELIREMVEE